MLASGVEARARVSAFPSYATELPKQTLPHVPRGFAFGVSLTLSVCLFAGRTDALAFA